MRLQVIKNHILFWCKKIFLYGAFIFISLFAISFIIFQFPEVQTALTNRYLSGFSQVVGFPASAERIDLRWYDRLELRKVKIKDPAANTMIGVDKLVINFGFLNLLRNGQLYVDGAEIDQAEVNLVDIYESDTSTRININQFIDKIKQQYSSGEDNKSTSSAKINIDAISVRRSVFSYNDPGEDTIKNGFDYHHFYLSVPEGDVSDFQIIGDTIQFQVEKLHVLDRQTKLQVKELNTYFRVSQNSMEFLNTDLKVGNSLIKDTIIFKYNSTDDLVDFDTKVNVVAKLKNCVVDPNDLSYFTYELPHLPYPITLSGIASGKVNRFFFRNMDLAMGKTKIKGKLMMDGLPSIDETFIDLKINEGLIHQNDLRHFIPENFYENIKALGTTVAQIEFTGFINDFVAKGDLGTALGQIRSDLNLKLNLQDAGESTYSGALSLNNFKLGNYLNDTTNFQRVTLNGRIKGKGLTEETADFFLTGKINSIGIRHYNYSNIVTNARLASQLFNGDLSIDDPYLQFNATGFVDFRKDEEVIKIKATLDSAFLDRLGFIKDPLFVKSYFDIDTKGLSLDSLFGKVIMRKSVVNYKGNLLVLDSIRINSSKQGSNRQLSLESSIADFKMEGNFLYTSLFNDLKTLVTDFYFNLINDRKSLVGIEQEENAKLKPAYRTTFELKANNLQPLMALDNLNLFISPGSSLKGEFLSGEKTDLHFKSNIDTLTYQGKVFAANEIEFGTKKFKDSLKGTTRLLIHSATQQLSSVFNTKNLSLDAAQYHDHIDLNFDVDQDGNTNTLRLKSSLDYLNDSIKLKILPTQLKIFNEFWNVGPNNYALFKGKEWNIHQLEIKHNQESILLDGFLTDNPEKIITLTIDSLGVDIVNSLLSEKVFGTMNGNVQARDVYNSPFIQNKLTIMDLKVDQFLVGNVTGANQWNRDKKRFDLNFTLERNGQRTVEMEGFYDPDVANPLFVNARLENTNIRIIEPFLRGIFSQMDGSLTGNYTITGSFLEPKVEGQGKVQEAQLVIDYLKTKYFFDGELDFTPSQILFKNFKAIDDLKNKATVKGAINHHNYDDMRINLDAQFTNFQLLNTTAKDNDLFYGTAYGTGKMNMAGPFNDLKISGTARSEKGTRMFIPLSGSAETSVAKKDFVTFVKLADSANVKKKKTKTKKSSESYNFTMDMNLDITPDAYGEIIFDIRSGDIIRGYGRGQLKLELDTKGDFNMFGDYEFEKGNYNFTLYDIINKEFNINKGSRITWIGDPYGGTLNLSASYKQLVSLAPIIQNQTYANSIAMRRKYPVEVQLKLDGAMMSPQINFDIIANDLPNNVPIENSAGSVQLNTEFKVFKSQLNEQELKRQVFSLIMLRRFSPQDAFATGGSIYSSVSELFSNQLSYWLTQVDQNLEVNFDLGNFDQEAFNTFQLRLSYSFLNGRLRVTRDGAFNNQYNRSEVSNMLGDWTVDYLLTPDGKFKVKMYSRNNINQLMSTTTIGSQTAITTGFSLLNTQNFNHWRDLITSARERRRKELEQQKQRQAEEEEEIK
jgi:hypothetical protein